MRLDAAKWREKRGVARILKALDAVGGMTRYVGGAVRDDLLGLPVSDIDFATRLRPDEVIARLEKAHIKAVPTGIDHGTVTAVADGQPAEITSLRADVSTDGRRATVAFTDDWMADASRRDFTINALYADPLDGEVHDYFGGLDDLEARRVRFIGDPLVRIAEDHLRILRFFRFHARFGGGEPGGAPVRAGKGRADQLKNHLEIQRMSKSKGNVVNPDDWVQKYGADTVRAYMMFGFDWQKGGPWDSKGIQGVVRWINDVWDMVTTASVPAKGDAEIERTVERRIHQTIKRVTDGLELFSFNGSIAGLMKFRNDMKDLVKTGGVGQASWREAMRNMLLLMAPFAPHVAEELWAQQGHGYSIHQHNWPQYDAEKAAEDVVTLVVQVNGKVRDRIDVAAGISEDEAKAKALASEAVQKQVNGGQPKKVIFIAGRNGQEPKVNVVV